MNKRIRRNHEGAFKLMVALEAVKERETVGKLSDRFQVHRNLIAKWKKQLLGRAEEVFVEENASVSSQEVQKLHGKMERLTMENEVLSVALSHIGRSKRKALIQRDHKLPISRQCRILGISAQAFIFS